MIIKSRTILFFVSLSLNMLFIVFLVSAFSGKTSSFSFSSPDKEVPSWAAVALVSITGGTGNVVFNTIEIELEKGGSASLQFSGIVEGRQANWIIETLYDHDIISVKKNGFGIVITALKPGETLMQTLTDNGFRDVAFIKVVE